ncbi:MAG: PAS domain-containing sensor histidine kinase [Candidatus Kapabacteria bacterium]|jgi:PAS domain S-box-containing protein|nr:PAS domain-containing sensor histidine kinase [Candidatus Kapabacteria bacterium]
MIRKSYYILLILFVAISSPELGADNQYPLSYNKYDVQYGSELYIIENTDSNLEPLSISFRPGWYGESEEIYAWHGIEQVNEKGGSLIGCEISDVFLLDESVLTIRKESNRLFTEHLLINPDLDDSLIVSMSLAELYSEDGCSDFNNARWSERVSENEILLTTGECLYSCSVDEAGQLRNNLIDKDVLTVAAFDHKSDSKFLYAYATTADGWTTVLFVNQDGEKQVAARLQTIENLRIFTLNDDIVLASSAKHDDRSLLRLIELGKGKTAEHIVNSHINLLNIRQKNKNKIILNSIEKSESGYIFTMKEFANSLILTRESSFDIPEQFIEPMAISRDENICLLLFRNGIVSFDHDGSIQSSDFIPIGEIFKQAPEIDILSENIILRDKNISILLRAEQNSFWYYNRVMTDIGQYLFPGILIIIMFALYRKFRKQNRLLTAMLDLPSAGVVFVVDRKGRLTRVNDGAKEALGLSGKVPLNRLFQYYCVREGTISLSDLVSKALTMRDTLAQKLDFIHDGKSKEWYCRITPLRNFTGKFRGLVITAIDITEELERKRLNNWAQLAHDMQTNLSTIRLNAEQMEIEEFNANEKRRSKIVHQVMLLIQRVRDIVTVGRSDGLERQMVSAAEICESVRAEFDETIFPHVKFELDLKHFNVSCDRPKIIRALRNAVENGVKALQNKPGTIIISDRKDARTVYFSVKDDGIGMDKETREKMLTPYYSGSKEKGHGIGTMIMQHVIDLHGGEMNVLSEPGKGSEIIFSLPDYSSSRE